MKKILVSAAFAALMASSGSAFALDVGFASVVNTQCVVPNSSTTQTRGFTLDANGAVPSGGPSTLLTLPNAYCTGVAKVEVKSLNGAITPGGAPAPIVGAPAGFANVLQYSASATWNSLTATVNADNTAPNVVATSAPSAGPATSSLAITYSTPGTGGLPLVAGTYSDTLVVKLIAN